MNIEVHNGKMSVDIKEDMIKLVKTLNNKDYSLKIVNIRVGLYSIYIETKNWLLNIISKNNNIDNLISELVEKLPTMNMGIRDGIYILGANGVSFKWSDDNELESIVVSGDILKNGVYFDVQDKTISLNDIIKNAITLGFENKEKLNLGDIHGNLNKIHAIITLDSKDEDNILLTTSNKTF